MTKFLCKTKHTLALKLSFWFEERKKNIYSIKKNLFAGRKGKKRNLFSEHRRIIC